jgi:hypothetical protein
VLPGVLRESARDPSGDQMENRQEGSELRPVDPYKGAVENSPAGIEAGDSGLAERSSSWPDSYWGVNTPCLGPDGAETGLLGGAA